MIRTPTGMMREADAVKLFEQCGYAPPAHLSVQEAFNALVDLARRQAEEEAAAKRPGRGRTAVLPAPATREGAVRVLEAFGASAAPLSPCGVEVAGLDVAGVGGRLPPDVAGALEVLMAEHGLVLLRRQGRPRSEHGVRGTFLSGEEQCALSECFGRGELHSTHGVHPKAPCRDVFRLSNDPDQGFNSVGPEWHCDGAFCRDVFSHVVYHIVKAPEGPGDTRFAHLGQAHDALPARVQARLARCASVNSNGGAVHPLAAPHPRSGRTSLFLHLGMTGAVLETPPPDRSPRPPAPPGPYAAFAETPPDLPTATRPDLRHASAWRDEDLEAFFVAYNDLCDGLAYSHKWAEGDVIIVDNLAVTHKAAPGAHAPTSGLRILHRTTVLSERNHDPPPGLKLPHTLETGADCPFGPRAAWREGYVGYRWGNYRDRAVPH